MGFIKKKRRKVEWKIERQKERVERKTKWEIIKKEKEDKKENESVGIIKKERKNTKDIKQ